MLPEGDRIKEESNVTDVDDLIAFLPLFYVMVFFSIVVTIIMSFFGRRKTEKIQGTFCEPMRHNFWGREK